MDEGITWVSLTYDDKSQVIFRGTKNIDIIRQCSKEIPDLDVYDSNGLLKEGFIYNTILDKVVEVEPGVVVETFESKPKYRRRVDKYASAFI